MNMVKMLGLASRFRNTLTLAALAALAVGAYLLASRETYAVGYPLDDAWIHQTYARNLGTSGEWRYAGGAASGGSTAPLWTALLAAGYWLKINPYLWTYFLGWGCLVGLGAIGMKVFSRLCPEKAGWQLWVGIGLVFEWHLVWAAGSGMETLLFSLLALGVLGALVGREEGSKNRVLRIVTNRGDINRDARLLGRAVWDWAWIGLLIGLSVWVRPEGITLLGPALLCALAAGGDSRERLSRLAWLMLGFGALFLLYLFYNFLSAGAWWPHTFYAKQAEYAVLRQASIGWRFLGQAALPLVGVGVLLLPGFVLQAWKGLRLLSQERSWATLAGVLWVLGFLGSYAWRLPVTYQHGRYAIPAMSVYFVWGFAGLAGWLQPGALHAWRRSLSRAAIAATTVTLGLFWIQGARAYARDVAVIESEMVAAARWLAQETEPGAHVAAHDIGALGYFGQRHLLDLAGLVSPEVIPIIRDEAALAGLLDSRSVDYLVVFPDWYPRLADRGILVFSTQAGFAPSLGAQNLAVYRWQGP